LKYPVSGKHGKRGHGRTASNKRFNSDGEHQ